MGDFKLQYTGVEAIETVKNYYPKDWQKKLDDKKTHLLRISNIHKISIIEAYKKFIIPLADNNEGIIFFAALSQLLKLENQSPVEKKDKIIELDHKREEVAEQLFALENSTIISYEDKKMLRSYYLRLQSEATTEINELINSFKVVEPKLVIHQKELFD